MARHSRYHSGQPWWGEPRGVPGDQERGRYPRWQDYHQGYAGDYNADFGPYGGGPYPPLGPRGNYGIGPATPYWHANPGPLYARPHYPYIDNDPYGHERDWWDRTRDELASWAGDEEAARRRQIDESRGSRHQGVGPRGYVRSDARISEDAHDRLTDAWLDASDIEVSVSDREVTLSGMVETRADKRRAEEIVETISGVTHVQNNLRVRPAPSAPAG